MRRAAAGLLVAALWGAAAVGHAEEGPGTRLGLLFGASEQVGSLGGRYGLGWTLGLEAGWVPSWLGVVWWVSYSMYWASDSHAAIPSISLWDFGGAIRGRAPLRPGALPIFGYAQLGLALVRSTSAVQPDNASSFVGPQLGVGLEVRYGRYFFGAEADYGLVTGGPSGLALVGRAGMGMF
jgi:hypothetical protein